MLDRLTHYADLPARAAMSAIFILSGVGKLGAVEQTQSYMEAFGLAGPLVFPAIAFEIGAGAALLLGLGTRHVALTLSGFSLVTALIFHRDFSDQIQQIMFLKNLAMSGGLLLMAKAGAPSLSIDGFFASRRKA